MLPRRPVVSLTFHGAALLLYAATDILAATQVVYITTLPEWAGVALTLLPAVALVWVFAVAEEVPHSPAACLGITIVAVTVSAAAYTVIGAASMLAGLFGWPLGCEPAVAVAIILTWAYLLNTMHEYPWEEGA